MSLNPLNQNSYLIDVETMHNGLKDYKIHAIRSSAHSFACTAYSFARFALLASLARSAALIRLLARSLTCSGAHGKVMYVYELDASI